MDDPGHRLPPSPNMTPAADAAEQEGPIAMADNTSSLALAYRLSDAARDIGLDAEGKPAPVVLACACRGFLLAEAISALPDRQAIPRRATFAVCEQVCSNAASVLRQALGEHLLRRYGTGVGRADLAVGALAFFLVRPASHQSLTHTPHIN